MTEPFTDVTPCDSTKAKEISKSDPAMTRPATTAPTIRASPQTVTGGNQIKNYAPVHRSAVEEHQTPKPSGRNLSTTTIVALACKCETAYAPRSFQRQKHSIINGYPMDRKKPLPNGLSLDTSRNNSDGWKLPYPAASYGVGQGRVRSIASSPSGSDVENFSWPSRRASAEQHFAASDSAVSLLTPTTKKASRISHLREVQLAQDESEPSTPPTEKRPRPDAKSEGKPQYPSPGKTVLIMISLYISIFLVALDRTIVGPAIPAITNQFNSITDVGWYASSYLLTSCGFILLYGRIYTFYPTKSVFLSGIFLFEIGSAICGAAQSSIMLIVGRAVAGLGSSGVYTGAILIMLNTVPLHRRPLLQGLFGACFGVASLTGPLLGGAFTGSGLTWRWCFYINIPLGAITIVVVTFLLKLTENKPRIKGWKDTLRQMDPLGTVLFLPGMTCLLLALEWGAAEYPWSSPRIIALLTTFAALITAFVMWQYATRNTTATVPARILLQRSVACGCASQFCVGATMLTVSIYIPLWFQAIKGVSAFQSGANSLPLVLSTVVGSILSGAIVQRIGYYTPFLIIGSCCMAVGTGLITTFTTHTESAKWIGYLIVLGIGIGFQMGHPNLAIQVVLKRSDVPIGTAILSLCQTLGGAVFTAVGQNLYIDKFSEGLQRIEGVDASHVLELGATDLTRSVAPELQERVLEAYNRSLTQGTFLAVLCVACLAVPAALSMEWRSVKKNPRKAQQAASQDLEMSSSREGISITDTRNDERALRGYTVGQNDAFVTPPTPTWRKAYRSSGQFSQWMTVKLNPDLRSEFGLVR